MAVGASSAPTACLPSFQKAKLVIPNQTYVSPTERRRRFRARLKTGRTIWVPGVYDGLSARLAEQAGAEAIILAGFAVSASLLGEADAEIYTMTEVRSILRHMVNATTIPVMADGDNGFGNALSVIRTVQEYEAAGATSITIEDQAAPKRCPMIIDKPALVPFAEAVGKIKAAVDARRDPETVIVARTDSLDLNEAIDRACAYVEAGADVIKPIWDDIDSLEKSRQLLRACQRPLSISIVEYIEEKFTIEQMEEVAAIATVPVGPITAVAKTLQQTFDTILKKKYLSRSDIGRMPVKDFKKVIGFEQIEAYEHQYLPPE